MPEHMIEWIGPYLDGELSLAQQGIVEAHLAACAECSTHLDEMKALSSLLHEPDPALSWPPAQRFAANLNLSLPRRTQATPYTWLFSPAGWLFPLGVAGLWLFLQVTLTVSGLLVQAFQSGWFGPELTWTGSTQAFWFSMVNQLTDGQFVPLLQPINNAFVFLQGIFANLFWQVALAALYLGWLYLWWTHQPDSQGDQQLSAQPG